MDDWQSDEGHEVLHDQDYDRKSRVEAVGEALRAHLRKNER